jgi:GAF domain-containing protein
LNVSLRKWFKAQIGFEPCETHLDSSVCAHALVEPDLLIIEDLSIDPRTRDNPLVAGEHHIRFYAGAPLRASNDAVLGSLCVIDGKPRPGGLTAPQAAGLRHLARHKLSVRWKEAIPPQFCTAVSVSKHPFL